MGELPAIHHRIMLRDDLGQEFASRVEDIDDDGDLTVARPLDLPAEHAMQVGEKLFVTWRTPNGIEVLPARIYHTRREGLVALWDVEIIGDGWREQRRSYVRAAVPGTVTVHWAASAQGDSTASGSLLDLSEASVRMRTTSAEFGQSAEQGLTLHVTLDTSEQTFSLAGEVLRSRPGREAGSWEVVLLFIDVGKAADDLRKLVFAQQLKERRNR